MPPQSTNYSARPDLIPLPEEGRGSYTYWKKEVDAAVQRLQEFKPDWDRNTMSYRAKPLTATPEVDAVVVPRDFAMVEQKSAQLFFKSPDVQLKTKFTPIKDAVSTWAPVLNHFLSEDEANAMGMMNECLFDALCPAGIMCSVIGYETYISGIQDVPTGKEIPDPNFEPEEPEQGLGQTAPDMLPGAILGTGAPMPPPPGPPMVPETIPVPDIVYSRMYWNRFSPAAAIIPSSWAGSIYDRAPYLGYRFKDTWANIKSTHRLPADMTVPKSKNTNPSDLKIKSEVNMDSSNLANEDEVTGWCIWYYTYLYDSNVHHPLLMRQLICLDGMKEPLVHRDSPYQKMVKGKLLGMVGNPVHIGALRYVSDSAYPPSECSISRSSNDELNKSRTQMMLQRDRSIPMRVADITRMGGQPGLDKVRQNRFQSIIGLPSWHQNDPPMGMLGLASYPRENFTFNDILDSDIAQIWAMGANQLAQQSEGDVTATETAKMDAWATTRLDKERAKALGYYMTGVRKFGATLQLFITPEQIAEVIGPEDTQRILKAWDFKNMPAPLSYTCEPDAAIRRDPGEVRTEALKLYELTAKDPHANSPELLGDLLRAFNRDPAKLVQPQLPPKPNPMAISIRIDPAQLDVRDPSFPIILALMEANGYEMLERPKKDPETGEQEPSPVEQALAMTQFQAQIIGFAEGGPAPDFAALAKLIAPRFANPGGEGTSASGGSGAPKPEHGGAAPKAERLSKHQGDQTGARPGPRPVQAQQG